MEKKIASDYAGYWVGDEARIDTMTRLTYFDTIINRYQE